MKIKKVGFTNNVVSLVNIYASNSNQDANILFERLAKVVSSEIPNSDFEVDTSDDSITFAGVPLSFLRNWKKGEATIMTNTEAIGLDYNTRTMSMWTFLHCDQ